MPIDRQKLDAQLILEEGKRLAAYRDSRGILTTGVGHNLDAMPLTEAEQAACGSDGRSGPITDEGAMFVLHNDEDAVFDELNDYVPWWSTLDEVRARVMAVLCFNMGWHTLSGFKNFLHFMLTGQFDKAADDLAGTAWYREVGHRGPRLVAMTRTGEDYTS